MRLFQHTILKEGFEAFLLSLMAQMEESKVFGVSSNIGVFRSATFKAKKVCNIANPSSLRPAISLRSLGVLLWRKTRLHEKSA